MLSPASLRVCCLAVMAPALTKADRRANCLPVVLSDPFCVSKTDTSDNRKDKINQIAKLPFKCAPLPNKRKPPHKIWVRTNGTEIPTNKNRLSAIDLRADFVNAKLGLHVEPKTKPCHGTSVRTMAAKVRLKYTMNKGNNSFKNMGLAKANTSLGLHSMKRMDRISQLSPNDKNSTGLGKESGEDVPDLADPTSSELETTFSFVRIVQPALEQSIEEVSSSSRNLIASSKHDTFVSLSDSDTLPVLSDASVAVLAPDNCSIPLSPDINSSLSSRDSVLPISLPDTESPLDASRNDARNAALSDILAQPQSPFISPPSCDILPNKADAENALPIDVGVAEEKASLSSASNASISNVSLTNDCLSHVNSLTVPHSSCTTKKDDHAPFEDEMSPLSPPFSPRCLSDIEAASPCSTFSSSSTLSADESPLPSSMDEGGDSAFFQFPDSLLGAKNPPVEVQSIGSTHLPYSTVKSWFENSPCIQDGNMRLPTEDCCSLPKQDRSSLVTMLTEQEKVLNVALKESEVLLREYTIGHVQDKIRTFVTQLKKKYDIPCQRQSRNAISKATVDLKAELLQKEDVKSLSTAALVSLVRRLETGASPANQPQDNELLAEAATVDNALEDSDDLRNTSKVLLTNMKSLLRSADPYMTESSDEGSSDVEMDDALDDTIQKRALWNFMKKRAALASRSTWLIARIHELENQLNTITGILKKVSTSIGDVPFEDHADFESSALSTPGSDGTSLPAVKPNRPKGLGRPVNGYLEHSFGGTKGSSETLERKLSVSSAANTEPSCSRTRALKTSSFQKRKVLITTGMHLTNAKLAKLSTVGCECNCQDELLPCILCMGRYSCVQSVDPDSLPLLDRVSLLDPNFHPLLSFEKDIPLLVHYENVLKKNEAQYQTVRPPSPVLNSHRRMRFGTSSNHFGDARSRSRKINRYARTLLSAKYRNKKHFRKHKLVFGKWRKFQNKSTFHARDRIRRLSVASSASSHDSPVPSPGSAYEDGFGYDFKRRRDDNQFDIDDVIIPYSNKKSRLVKFEFKDIEIPSWRSKAFGNLQAIDIEEDTSDSAFIKRHEGYEVEERKIIRNGGGAKCFFNTWQKRSSRMHRSDSRADSSGANTPDPVLLYDQDIMFQDTNSQLTSNPPSPALSPPATPGSAHLISDDSQPALRAERRRSGGAKRPDEFSNSRDYDEIAPYSPRVFPLPDNVVEEMLADAEYTRYDTDVTASGPSCPASPDSSTSSASTVDDEDITDPEWRVVRRESGPEQALVLKFAKR